MSFYLKFKSVFLAVKIVVDYSCCACAIHCFAVFVQRLFDKQCNLTRSSVINGVL